MTTDEQAKAAAIVAEWVWQPYDGHNYGYAGAVNTLTRYVEAASMQPDELRLVIAYLKAQEITGNIALLNRTVDLGTGWKAKDAWFQTASDKWANTDATRIRIYQVLIQAPSGTAGDGPYVVENGCQYKVSHTFYWDVATLPTVTAGTSGVGYTMQGVTRDRETGLWSCVIEKRERVQQDVAEYKSGETAFETVKEESHHGVKQDSVSSTGKAASAGNGKIVRRKVTKNADCTSDVQNVTSEEKAVAGVRKAWRKTLRGTVASVTDRSQASALGGTGLAIGETRTSEETEGGRWNNTTETTTAEAAGKIGAGCDRTSGTHTDTTITNEASEPTVEQGDPGVNVEVTTDATRTELDTWDVRRTRKTYTPQSVTTNGGSSTVKTTTKVGVNQETAPTGAAGGVNVVKRTSATPNDHGSYSTSEETVTYSPQSVTSVGGTPTVRTETKVGVNQTSAPAGGVGGVNEVKRTSATPNDHGSYSTSEETVTYSPQSVTTSGGSATVKTTTKVGVNQTSAPRGSAGGVNVVKRASATPNDHGSYSTSEETVTYVPKSVTTNGGSSTVKTTTKVGVNQTSAPTGAAGGVNVVKRTSATPNDHGSYSTSEETVTYVPKSVTTNGGSSTVKTTTKVGVNQETAPAGGVGGVNEVKRTSATPNDHGSYSTSEETVTYSPSKKTKSWSDGSYRYTLTTYRNQPEPLTPDGSYDISSVSFTMNDHGSYDGSVYTKASKSSSGENLQWSSTSNCSSLIIYKKNNEKFYKRVATGTVMHCFGKASHVANAIKGGDSCELAGWKTGMSMSGVDKAYGVKYSGIALSIEVSAEPSTGSSSGSQS